MKRLTPKTCEKMCLQLPLELEHEVFLMLKDEPDVLQYALVAKCIQVWYVIHGHSEAKKSHHRLGFSLSSASMSVFGITLGQRNT